MATWKKVGIAVLVLVILAGIGVGTFFIVKAVKNKKTPDGVVYSYRYLEDEYFAGEKMVLEVIAQDKTAFTAMKYTIDSGEETTLKATTGETKDNAELNAKKGDYYIDSGTQTIETMDLQAGTHVLTVFVYHDTTRVILFEHVFKITDAA